MAELFKWKKVKDEKPPFNTLLLIYLKNKTVEIASYGIDEEINRGKPFFINNHSLWIEREISHFAIITSPNGQQIKVSN
ncbi:hypothetical protein NSA18_11495 [Pasteurella caecimuris]|uniref:hypothetical protein n=1 Tax=Rodentibacter caecimuris TaxID=1796644 RepID=UPI00214FC592|nr:hypothetical protein [Pasteurella caecimuris]MCR1838503.1 hypothetical protein [Pasteurella caecimuris]MCU0108123.1 hypothetical protein [Pasteurella caecimuris]